MRNQTQPNEREDRGMNLDKPKCIICDNAHYGECWFNEKVKCHHCDKFGHMMRDSHQPKKGQMENYANQVQDSTMMFYSCCKKIVEFGAWN